MWWRTTRPEPEISLAANMDGAVLPPSLAAVAVLGPKTASAPSEMAAPRVSPGRQALASAITAPRTAVEQIEAAQAPLRRLQEPIDDLAEVYRRLTEIDQQTDVAVGRWIADGGAGDRPVGPPEVVGLRHKRDTLAPDATAARLILPGAQTEFQRVAQAAVAAARQKDESLVIAAAEAAREVIEAELVPAVEKVVEIEARVAGLAAALREAGDRAANPLPGAVGISVQINDMVREAKHRPAVPLAIDQARQFLNTLAVNAEAALP